MRIHGSFFAATRVPRAKKLWETLAYCIDVACLRCVLVPAVSVVQSTCPPYNIRVTVQESMCRCSAGFMLGRVNESCRHTPVLVIVGWQDDSGARTQGAIACGD